MAGMIGLGHAMDPCGYAWFMNGTEHDPTPGANFAGKQYSLAFV